MSDTEKPILTNSHREFYYGNIDLENIAENVTYDGRTGIFIPDYYLTRYKGKVGLKTILFRIRLVSMLQKGFIYSLKLIQKDWAKKEDILIGSIQLPNKEKIVEKPKVNHYPKNDGVIMTTGRYKKEEVSINAADVYDEDFDGIPPY